MIFHPIPHCPDGGTPFLFQMHACKSWWGVRKGTTSCKLQFLPNFKLPSFQSLKSPRLLGIYRLFGLHRSNIRSYSKPPISVMSRQLDINCVFWMQLICLLAPPTPDVGRARKYHYRMAIIDYYLFCPQIELSKFIIHIHYIYIYIYM